MFEDISESQSLEANFKDLRKRVDELEEWRSRVEGPSALNHSQEVQSSILLCLLDGDGYIFNKELLKRRADGGREAAQHLREGLQNYLKDQGHSELSRHPIWLDLYLNKHGLSAALKKNQICKPDDFEDFLRGFHQASPSITIVDAGHGKEAVDTKIKEKLRVFTRFPQIAKVFFGGGHDSGYAPTLNELRYEGLGSKVILIDGYNTLAPELRDLGLPRVSLEGLFMKEKLAPIWSPSPRRAFRELPEASSTMPYSDSMTTSPAPSPGSGPEETLFSTKEWPALGGLKPGPCVSHYLEDGCKRRKQCHFGHNYDLSPAQMAELIEYAKTLPCVALNYGKECRRGDACPRGHYCPYGTQCQSKDRGCAFKGSTMHDGPGATPNRIKKRRRSSVNAPSPLQVENTSLLGGVTGSDGDDSSMLSPVGSPLASPSALPAP